MLRVGSKWVITYLLNLLLQQDDPYLGVHKLLAYPVMPNALFSGLCVGQYFYLWQVPLPLYVGRNMVTTFCILLFLVHRNSDCTIPSFPVSRDNRLVLRFQ